VRLGTITIVRPGLLTTVQDLGRHGHQAAGVPVAGPMDVFSSRLANELVANGPDAATLEVTLIGPEIEVDVDTTVAVTGAHFEVWRDGHQVPLNTSIHLGRGQRLRFGKRIQGARAYLGVAGGVQSPAVLGSRATQLVCRMGGHEGRSLAAGDRVPILAGEVPREVRKAVGLVLPTNARARLRVIPGPQADWFHPDALRAFSSVSFRISPRSNRMGYRLEGPPLARVRDGELISEPVAMGAIQVPGAGEPILLMADCQTAGGYPKIGHVISADLPLAGQLAPGEFIEFILCTRQEAVTGLIARERQLLRYSALKGTS